MKQIKTALISVYNKEGIEPIASFCKANNISIYSTGGTQRYLEEKNIPINPIEQLTAYPSILGGRVKTLHPKVFGGILARENFEDDKHELEKYNIPTFDLVVVDLYPFKDTLSKTRNEQEIIEKIDIGGISLIRAAAKNFNSVACISNINQYKIVLRWLQEQNGKINKEQRKSLALEAFKLSSEYDKNITDYFAKNTAPISEINLRYGENPHQKATFIGNLVDYFEKINGKDLSYNNLVDIDSAVNCIADFNKPTFAIIKHTNTCGLASDFNIKDAYQKALSCDPTSAFGGIFICNRKLEIDVAEQINKLFYEVLIAPEYSPETISLLCKNPKRIILRQKEFSKPELVKKSLLNGIIVQDYDKDYEEKDDFTEKTNKLPSQGEIKDLNFAIKAVKHLKSNAIAIVKDEQLIGMGCGQTSRVDALNQALSKAKKFEFNVQGAVMASDAFFPFPDCVEIAAKNGITAIAQPGGSINDNKSIDSANKYKLAMVFTHKRHFKH